MSGSGRGVTPGPESGAGSDSAPDPAPETAENTPGADSAADPGATSAAPAAGSKARQAKPRGSRAGRFLREFVILVVIALLIATAIKTYAVQAFYIPSGSMQNTLEINDRVLVNKMVYDTRSIHRGDIVVFNGDGSWDPGEPAPVSQNFVEKFFSGFASMFGFGAPGDILIKRVIGLPGDHVACCNAKGQVTVNGIALDETSYLYPGNSPSQYRFDITVPPGRLWVMGDHRAISDDSRDHEGDPGGGTVPENAVIGRAFVIIWPPSQWKFLNIPSTFEQPKLNESSPASTSQTGLTQTEAASLLSAPLKSSGSALPLSLGFAFALPLSWGQRRLRRRVTARRARRDGLPARSGP